MFLCECVYLCVCMCISLCEHVYVKALLPSKPLPHLLLTTAVGLGKVLEGAGPALGSEKALLNCQSLASPVPSSAGRPVPAGLLCGGHERWLCAQSLGFRPGSLSRPRQVTGPPGVSCPLDPEAAPCVSSHSCFSGPPDIRPQSTSRKVLAWVRFWVHSLCAHVLVGGGGAQTHGLSPHGARGSWAPPALLQLGPAPQTHRSLGASPGPSSSHRIYLTTPRRGPVISPFH